MLRIAAIALLKVVASAIKNVVLKLKEDVELLRLTVKPTVSANPTLTARIAHLPAAKMDVVWMLRPDPNQVISLYLWILICSLKHRIFFRSFD